MVGLSQVLSQGATRAVRQSEALVWVGGLFVRAYTVTVTFIAGSCCGIFKVGTAHRKAVWCDARPRSHGL